MSLKEAAKLLAVHLNTQVDGLLKKRANYETDLKKDLSGLYAFYGGEVVDHVIPEGSLNLVISGEGSPAKSRNGPRNPNTPTEKVSVLKKRRRRQSKSTPYGLSIAELKLHVEKAVEAMRSKAHFNRNDITGELSRANIVFNPSYVSLMLTSMMTGIKKIGTEPRSGKGGPPMNKYKVTGKLGWMITSQKKAKKK